MTPARALPDPAAGAAADEAAWIDRTLCAPLGLAPDAAALARLVAYLDLLQRWNAVYNLTAVRDRREMLRQHLADCLAVVGPVARWLESTAATPVGAASRRPRIADIGSGGGLPGVVLAILLPQADVWCVDAVGKKAAFIRQVGAALALPNLHGVHARVEGWRPDEPFDLVTCRAWAALGQMTRLTAHLLRPGAVWAAMKSRRADAERADLPATVEVFHVEPLTVPTLDGERCLVWMRPR